MDRHMHQIDALSWAGQHQQVLARCEVLLGNTRLRSASRMALYTARLESLVALVRLADAALDADAMMALAERVSQGTVLRARALTGRSLVLMRQGQVRAAEDAAQAAVDQARRSDDERLLAACLLRLGEAQFRATHNEASLATAQQMADLFERLRDPVGLGRTFWVRAFAHARLAQQEASRAAAFQAEVLARQTGDQWGLANALNVQTFTNKDIAQRMALSQQAEQAYGRAGQTYGRSLAIGNYCLALAELGLYRQALRRAQELLDAVRHLGAKQNLTLQLGGNINWQIQLGDLDAVHALWPEYAAAVAEVDEPISRGDFDLFASALDLAEGRPAAVVKRLRAKLRGTPDENPAHRQGALVMLARALMAQGDAPAALKESRRAAQWHRDQNYGRADFGLSQDIWLWHARALAANGRLDEAWEALQRAHELLLDGVRNVRDAGLRRSFLNKVQVNRDIVLDWLRESRQRPVPPAQRLAHLTIDSDTREPFKRLVDTGVRLNALRSADALQAFLVEEVSELTGAERVLLVFDDATGLQIAGSLLPQGEDKASLLGAITPWLEEARLARVTRLRHGPDGAEPVDQRSCLVAPLVVQQRVLGYLYADIEGAFGRFGDPDQDLLAMLAGQAAVALDNTRWAQGLEAKVEARTHELNERVGELEVISAIQRGVAGQLDFQAIATLVGDKLREVFHTGDVSMVWWDEASDMCHTLYNYEHGAPIPHRPPRRETPMLMQWLRTRQAFVFNTRAEQIAAGLTHTRGTDQAHSIASVPIIGSNRVLGWFALQDHEREYAYGPADVRLLTTIASSMGVALENARLVEETQEALSRQTATAEVLKVISNSVSDTAPVFATILECGLQLVPDVDAISIELPTGHDQIELIGTLFGHVRGDGAVGQEARKAELTAWVQAAYPLAMEGSSMQAAFRAGHSVQFVDALHGADSPAGLREVARRFGHSWSSLNVPMLHDGQGIGQIVVARRMGNGFSERERLLFEGFADQAVIAIQNARLFRETQEALERQTATADVLQVISGSMADAQPVFDKIVESCARLFACPIAGINLVVGDDMIDCAAYRGPDAQKFRSMFPHSREDSGTQLVIDARRALDFPDALAPEDVPGSVRRGAQLMGGRSAVFAPLMWEDRGIGSIFVCRDKVMPFAEREIALLKAFADQAVIAIQNARVFNELEARNRDVTEALEQQTATAEILNVISGSPTDTQPVFDVIVRSAAQLFGRKTALRLVEGDGLHRRARSYDLTEGENHGPDVLPIDRRNGAGKAVLDGCAMQTADTFGANATDFVKAHARELAFRSIATAPLMLGGAAIGVISMSSPEPGLLSDQQMALLSTFADQAV
ncbi:MAG: GAF domain-containing protein, partial [Betaproteobacteria bacterium]